MGGPTPSSGTRPKEDTSPEGAKRLCDTKPSAASAASSAGGQDGWSGAPGRGEPVCYLVDLALDFFLAGLAAFFLDGVGFAAWYALFLLNESHLGHCVTSFR